MRIYVLCTSYSPLTVYLYRSGFARFAHDHYDNLDVDNLCTPRPRQTSTSPTWPSTSTPLPTSSASAASGSSTNSKTSCSPSTPPAIQNWDRQGQRCLFGHSAVHHQVHEGSAETGLAIQLLLRTLRLRLSLRRRRQGLAARSQRRVHLPSPSPSMSANTPEDSVLKVGLVDDVMTVINVEGMYFPSYPA
jgi:tubulin polyglutamylase TTLL9